MSYRIAGSTALGNSLYCNGRVSIDVVLPLLPVLPISPPSCRAAFAFKSTAARRRAVGLDCASMDRTVRPSVSSPGHASTKASFCLGSRILRARDHPIKPPLRIRCHFLWQVRA